MTAAVISRSPPEVQLQQNSSSAALLGNTLACGLAAGYLFGPITGVCCMVAHVALAQLNDRESQRSWFPLNSKTVGHLKNYWDDSPDFFKIQAVVGVVLRVLGLSLNQIALNWLRDSLTSPYQALSAIFRICVVAPLIEETIFRGFLQEKIRDVQVYFFGKNADSQTHTIARVALQAIAFGAAHFHPAQGMFNLFIVLATGFIGFNAGLTKEMEVADKTHSGLWKCAAFHGHLNTSVTARVCAFGV